MSKVGMLGVVKNAVYEIQCTIHRRCSSFLHVRVLVPVELSKRLSGPLKLVLQMVVMHHVGAWNRTRGLLQEQVLLPLGYLSSGSPCLIELN